MRFLSGVALLGALALPAHSATLSSSPTAPVSAIGAALPPEVVAAIKSASNVETLFPVDGAETFPGQILKADKIVFHSGSTLTLSSDAPWIVVVAKSWIFEDANTTTRIQRNMSLELTKPTVSPPKAASGKAGQGTINKRGEDGQQGSAGLPGVEGYGKALPHIYLIAGSFSSPTGEPLPGYLRLSLIFPGFDGSPGGDGGQGGDGGHGKDGQQGEDRIYECHDGAGPGGTGGKAGPGGRGGKGGPGGNGAGVTLIGAP